MTGVNSTSREHNLFYDSMRQYRSQVAVKKIQYTIVESPNPQAKIIYGLFIPEKPKKINLSQMAYAAIDLIIFL